MTSLLQDKTSACEHIVYRDARCKQGYIVMVGAKKDIVMASDIALLNLLIILSIALTLTFLKNKKMHCRYSLVFAIGKKIDVFSSSYMLHASRDAGWLRGMMSVFGRDDDRMCNELKF